jgi:hypothetical protein
VAEQRQEAVGDEVRRRLVAAEQEQHARIDDLIRAQRFTAVVHLDEGRHEVVARMLAVHLHEAAQVLRERDESVLGPGAAIVGPLSFEDERGDLIRPAAEQVAILRRHAEHRGDDVHLTRGGQVQHVLDQ